MVELPRLPELDGLPPIPQLEDVPSFEDLDDENCEPCNALKGELTIRCERITKDPEKVKACAVDLGRIVGKSKEIGPEAMREQMYNTFLKYRDPRPESSVAPEVEPSTKTA